MFCFKALRVFLNFAGLRQLLATTAMIFFGMLPSLASAQASGCTALWGISNSAAAPVAYFNRTTNAFVPLAAPSSAVLTQNGTLAANVTGNALGVFGGTGALYFSTSNQRANNPGMIRAVFDNVGGTVTFTNQGSISIPASITYTTTAGAIATAPTGAYVGATFDNSDNTNRRMYLLASGTAAVANVPRDGTTTAGSIVAMIGVVDPETPGAASWTTIVSTTATGTVTYPITGTSGDIYFDRTNQSVYYITNTAPARFMRLLVNTTGLTMNSVLVGSTATFLAGGVSPANTFGLALDPATNNPYFTDATSANFLIDSATLNSAVVTSSAAGVAGPAYGDTGSCIDRPLLPTLTKSFNPTTSTAATGTTTLTVTISNPNLVPIFTNAALLDNLPANMVIATPLSTSVQCFSNGAIATRPSTTTITAVVGATSFSVPSGAFIAGGNPGGGSCSFSVVAAATLAEIYPNSIPSGSLTTTAGTNTLPAQATYTLRITDFEVAKSQSIGVGGATTTAALTVPGAATMQYQLTITNNGPLTASSTFTDTIPALLTPSLAAITAVSSGGAGCTTATAVVGNQLVLTGTLTSAPPGGQCVVTVTLRGSSTLSTLTSATNTITVSSSPTFSGGTGGDKNTANNSASVLTFVGPSANITISKTNGTTTLGAGGTTSYTVNIANLGPADAAGSIFTDPVAAGLSCTAVSCTATAANICPAAPTISALQSTGLTLSPTFPAGSTANFVITCAVTATGQ